MTGLGVGLLLDLVRSAVGDDPALAHQQQPVAALGLVHHVARDEDGRAALREVVEERPEVLAQDRVEPDRGLVEHQQVGLSQQGHGQAGAAALAAAEPADHLPLVAAEVDCVDDPGDLFVTDTEHAGEEPEVLDDGEVVVHAGRLGDVADPVAQRPAAGRLPEDGHAAAGDALHADQAPHQRRLAAPRRPHQPGHPAADRHLEVLQHGASPAYDVEVADLDRVFHHVMNYAGGGVRRQGVGAVWARRTVSPVSRGNRTLAAETSGQKRQFHRLTGETARTPPTAAARSGTAGSSGRRWSPGRRRAARPRARPRGRSG